MQLIDCHTHTQFSMDSEADINAMIKRAKELNLAAYAITDHCECNCWYPKEHYENTELFDYFNYKDDFEASLSAVTELKEKYSDFNLICGTELGQPLADLEIAEKCIADSRLDFVISSVHQIKDEKDFFYINYYHMSTAEINNLLERYFSEVYELCKWGKFDVLGHLTYCLRYMKIRNGITPNMKLFDEIIAESLRTLADKGKGIEINTSGIRQGFGTTFPSLKYIKLFREFGGKIISIGSDAHKVRDLGANIAEGTELAKAAGFSEICYFKKRQPVFIKIS
ncbi:MAG: histidinol-phosphatase HisJ family protein [Ruminococcus sp.]|nr:histidinol-phosphatase HisJ family protein [Ruminococcus sp.]